jgi:WD40 repeat protein
MRGGSFRGERGSRDYGRSDSSQRVWEKGRCVATVLHPCQTVWAVASLPNGDLVSAGSDGQVRIWTTDERRFASAEDRRVSYCEGPPDDYRAWRVRFGKRFRLSRSRETTGAHDASGIEPAAPEAEAAAGQITLGIDIR